MTKTPEQMIAELYTVILGVPNTADRGMAKQVEDIEKHLRQLNGDVARNTSWRKAIIWMVGILAAFSGILAGVCFN